MTKQKATTVEDRENSLLAELTEQQKTYVFGLLEGKSKLDAMLDAGYSKSYARSYNPMRTKPAIKAAYLSLLHEFDEERSKRTKFSRAKIMEDLEYAKMRAIAACDDDSVKGAGALSAYTRSCELQGRELGMFAQKHIHEHEHSIVPTDVLLRKLAQTNPTLAAGMAKQLGVVLDGEFEEVSEG